jgi:hypothetical protein
MPRRPTQTNRELHVVFDTNALYTQAPHELVSSAVRALVEANSNYSDLQVSWYIPDVVALERHHQMLQQARRQLPAFQQITAILRLGYTLLPDELPQKIADVIEAELTALNISRLQMRTEAVNWKQVIHDAAFRNPPFDDGAKTEKGFRDAMILEAFVQLIEATPVARCRIVLVTNDGLLTSAAQARIGTRTNAQVLPGLEELRNLINTLVSTVDETFVRELREKADRLFFTKDDKKSLYYRENIYTRISEQFRDKLTEVPRGSTGRDRGAITLTSPRFIRKVHQRVHWVSQLAIASTAYSYASPSTNTVITPAAGSVSLSDLASGNYTASSIGEANRVLTIGDLMSKYSNPALPLTMATLSTAAGLTKTGLRNGESVFDVSWSATVNRQNKLITPTIDGIAFVETTWDD